jgi:hypothetical protein
MSQKSFWGSMIRSWVRMSVLRVAGADGLSITTLILFES